MTAPVPTRSGDFEMLHGYLPVRSREARLVGVMQCSRSECGGEIARKA